MKDHCYCCDELATTSEHVPPQCLFPEAKDLPAGVDLRKNLITVPSCKAHNLSKSGDDEYLMYVLSMNLPVNSTAEDHFSTKVWRAIDRRPALAIRMLAESTPVLVRDPNTGKVFESAQFKMEEERLYRTLEMVALGVYRYHFSRRWRGKLRVLAEFMRFTDLPDAATHNSNIALISSNADRLFTNSEFIGANPEVFRYQVSAEPACPVVMRLHFYGGVKVLAFFGRGDA